MPIQQILLVFDFQSGTWVDDSGHSHKWNKVKALRKPTKAEQDRGVTGLTAYDKKDDKSLTYDLKLPEDLKDFPTFSNLPGFFLFDYELAGGSLQPIAAVSVQPIPFPDV